jgi:hypothetical protein
MLTFAQSLLIARSSIEAGGGANIGNIDQNDTLDKAGIPDPIGLRGVKRLACESTEFGAPNFDHTLDFNALSGIDNSSTVGDFADKIQANAQRKQT